MKTCPRCDVEGCTVLTESPVKGCWVVYSCPRCFFVWRSTEPEKITDPAKYDPRFKLTAEKISNFAVVPSITPPRQRD